MNDKKPKKGYGFIYKYTSPSGKSYIGQTVRSLSERAGHNGKNYKGCSLFFRAIQKYGLKNFDVEILAEVPRKQLNEQEKRYIHLFNSLAPNGYNISAGGEQIGPSKKARPIYQYSSKDGSFLKKWENISEVCEYYNTIPQVFEACLLEKNYTAYNFCWSYIKMEKYPINKRIVNPQKKKIYCYSLDGKLIKEYNSITEAEKDTHLDRSAIKRCCRKEIDSCGGFKWRADEILLEKKYNNHSKSITQIDPANNKVIHVFPSISSAARALGKSTSLLRRVIDDESKTAYGYKWKTAQGSTTKHS